MPLPASALHAALVAARVVPAARAPVRTFLRRTARRRGLGMLALLAAAAPSVAAQPACQAAFTDSLAVRELRALDRVAAVPPVWDDYTLARHPLLLLADTTHRGGPAAPVCAALWRAGAPLEVLELAAAPTFSAPLYGMVNLDSIGARANEQAPDLASASQPPPPDVAAALRARGVTRAVVLAVPLDFGRLGRFGDVLRQLGADPVWMHADLAVHESFHLHAQFPTWLDQPRTYAWPAWDVQPDRPELRTRCYAGSPALTAALDAELTALLDAYDAVNPDSVAPDPALGRHHARRFVALRAARRVVQDTMTVAQGGRRIPCGLAEDLMELEEGTAQWIGHATTVGAGLTTRTRLRGSYAAAQPEVFYKTGPLQLWVLDGLLGRDAMRRVTAAIARSTGPDGGVFGQFVAELRQLEETGR